MNWVIKSSGQRVVTNDTAIVWGNFNSSDIRFIQELSFIYSDFSLNCGAFIELSLTLNDEFFDKSNIFFKAFYLNIFLKHFNKTLCNELLKKFSVDSLISNFRSESFFDIFLNTFNKLMSEFHFGHSGLVDFSTFHDFDFCFKIFLFFMEIRFILIFRFIKDFVSFELLLVSWFLLDDRDFLILVFANSVFELFESTGESLLVIVVHSLIKISKI